MPSVVVRNIDAETKERLRLRAAANGRSMEAELRRILSDALSDDERHRGSGLDFLRAVRARVEPLGGVELDIADRKSYPERPLPDFDS